MRASVRLTTVLVLVLTLGLHWALLQTLAWTGMVISYSRDVSVREALSMTFDGEHPCSLCKVVKQGRTDEKRQEQHQVKTGSKLDLALIWQSPFFAFGGDRALIPCPDVQASSRTEQPPKPRPRGFQSDNSAFA